MSEAMRIAIIGGGLAGISLAILLSRHTQLDVELYEAKEFSERGASVGLGRNALAAMDRIIPSAMDTLIGSAGAVPTESIRVIVGSGEAKGEVLLEIPDIKPRISVPRASLLKELLARLPPEKLHANMKLKSIEQDRCSGSVTIEFENGTAKMFDAVIGADGIMSSVRDYVLGGEEPASAAGFWDCWGAFPVEKVRGKIEEEYLKPGQQYALTSDGQLLLYGLGYSGTMVTVIISSLEGTEERRDGRSRELSTEDRNRLRTSWDMGQGIAELILSTPSLQAYSQWEHRSTRAYHDGNLCLIGDAAHASTPWQGAGAGQALEDCVVLSALLAAISDPRNLRYAFQAFESARMPRCKQVVESSREVGNILCSQGRFENLDAWRKALESKWDHVHLLNLEEQEEQAMDILSTLIASAS